MNAYLLPTLEHGPRAVKRLLEKIPQSRWDERLQPDRFSPREVIAHLADWEPIMLQRIKTARETPGGRIMKYDEAQMAIDHDYAHSDPSVQADRFIHLRAETATYLRTVNANEWTNVGIHDERGEQSVEDLANFLLGHDMYHLEQLSEYLATSAIGTW